MKQPHYFTEDTTQITEEKMKEIDIIISKCPHCLGTGLINDYGMIECVYCGWIRDIRKIEKMRLERMKKDCLCYENPSGVCMGCFNKALQEQAKEIFEELEKIRIYKDSLARFQTVRDDYEELKKRIIGEVRKE